MKLKKLEELTIRDDFIFGKVFEDTELAKELISRILPELHLKDLKCVIRQRDLKDSYGTRGIRLDIYSENEEYLFGVEMHNNRRTFSPKRARYYKATTNMYLLEQGQDVDELKDLYIIIICTYDPFGHDKMIYRYENVCHETGEELKDGEHIVYVNCTAAENIETEIGRFCRYVMSGEVQDRFTGTLEEKVQRGRRSPEWKESYMVLELKMMEMMKEARKEGLEMGRKEGLTEGRAEGRAEGRNQQMISDLKVMKLAVQSLMNKMNLSLDETLTLLDYPQDTQAELRKLIQEEGKAG